MINFIVSLVAVVASSSSAQAQFAPDMPDTVCSGKANGKIVEIQKFDHEVRIKLYEKKLFKPKKLISEITRQVMYVNNPDTSVRTMTWAGTDIELVIGERRQVASEKERDSSITIPEMGKDPVDAECTIQIFG